MSAETGPDAPIAVATKPPPGYWRRESSHFPQPLSPMTRSLMIEPINVAFRRVFAETGALLEGVEFREIGGWVYNRQVPLGGKDRKAPPKWLMWLAVRTIPSLRRRVRTNLEGIRSDLTFQWVERWYNEWRPAQEAAIARLRAVDLQELDDAAFIAYVATLRVFFEESINIHFRLAAVSLPVVELVFACDEMLGWDERRGLSLLTGLSTTSTEPARRLAELTRMAAERQAVREAIESGGPGTAARLASIDAEFAAAFDAYQHDFACRALRYEVADPTLAELPDLTVTLIRDQMTRGYDPMAAAASAAAKREETAATARATLSTRPAADGARFDRLLARAQRVYPVREDNEFTTVSVPLALARYAAREAGRRLVTREELAEPDDVFFLEWHEMAERLEAGGDARDLVARRKRERKWVLEHPALPAYGTPPGPPPSFDALPAETAVAMKAILWAFQRVFEEDRTAQKQMGGATLKGIAAAPGRYTGPVRVILSEDEFDKIEAGDVLVCSITSPVWSIIFPSVGALVTDTGGILSHPAIISREYGVPAVVATGNATALLKDGQVVTVDGDRGVIEIVGA
ncbi:MAG: PEP-utilizing enzyme [Tepidiformaceae bacterium]